MGRRAIRLGGLYAVAGSLLTLAVAWGVGLAAPPMRQAPALVASDRPRVAVVRWTGFGMEMVMPFAIEEGAPFPARRVERLPGAVALALDWRPRDPSVRAEFAVMQGWPAHALVGWTVVEHRTGRHRAAWALVVPGAGRGANGYIGGHALPLRVLWRGFLLDTLVYACACCALHRVGVAARRWRRGRRGACVGCGYDRAGLEGAACPECGMGGGGSGD